jgi:hypothetical protein
MLKTFPSRNVASKATVEWTTCYSWPVNPAGVIEAEP